ncbi:hypothetical protein C2S51_037474 [Perilla frutescens var. frutescens]|nr:hypothetical protein C2S51_037474 [Perilla frutescens var. frutescens]
MGINEGMMVLMMVMICCGIGGVSAAVYTVGDSSGWSMGVDYTTWTSDKTFRVGDTLVFNYGSSHSVDEVNSNDYKTCATGNAITSDSSGATSITLKTAGPHYYVCGIPGHCDGGMKLAITVAADGGTKTAPSASGTTTSPPSTTTTSPVVTTPARGTVAEQPSSSSTFTPSAAVFFGFFFAALTYFLM